MLHKNKITFKIHSFTKLSCGIIDKITASVKLVEGKLNAFSQLFSVFRK